MRQIEQMESEELMTQKKLRTEVIQLEDMLSQVRKEYEMLRIEFEQNLAANEQTGPINKEMRNLIQSLQTHNVQLKGEVARYKRKCKETILEINKLRKDLDDMKTAEIKALQVKKELMLKAMPGDDQLTNNSSVMDHNSQDDSSNNCHENNVLGKGNNESAADLNDDAANNGLTKVKSENMDGENETQEQLKEDQNESSLDNNSGGTPIKQEKSTPTTPGGTATPSATATPIKKELIKVEPKELREKIDELHRLRAKDVEVIKDLKAQLKKAQNDVKEMKLLLDMYKTCTKEQRDKAQIMAAEKKVKAELEEARSELKRVREAKKEEKKRLADEDAQRRIKQLEEQCAALQKQVANHKQEEEALLSEMEVTGQAFEDMQEQNSRLIQQLREKDDANFKLMSERIKSNQVHFNFHLCFSSISITCVGSFLNAALFILVN